MRGRAPSAEGWGSEEGWLRGLELKPTARDRTKQRGGAAVGRGFLGAARAGTGCSQESSAELRSIREWKKRRNSEALQGARTIIDRAFWEEAGSE